jgi:hypothetical protein
MPQLTPQKMHILSYQTRTRILETNDQWLTLIPKPARDYTTWEDDMILFGF